MGTGGLVGFFFFFPVAGERLTCARVRADFEHPPIVALEFRKPHV